MMMILFTDLLKAGFSYTVSPDSKLTVDVNGKKDLTDFNLHATLQTPSEKLKNAELSLKNKVSSISSVFLTRLKRNLTPRVFGYCIIWILLKFCILCVSRSLLLHDLWLKFDYLTRNFMICTLREV
jgi:hypothetical protein